MKKKEIIKQYVFRMRKGKIMVNGDNLTVCGNPYALLLYSVGEDFEKDPTLSQESNCIQCYTKRFDVMNILQRLEIHIIPRTIYAIYIMSILKKWISILHLVKI